LAYREYVHWPPKLSPEQEEVEREEEPSVTAPTHSAMVRSLTFVPFVIVFLKICYHLMTCHRQHANAWRLVLLSYLFALFGAYLWYYGF
jgi:hypothetical protein